MFPHHFVPLAPDKYKCTIYKMDDDSMLYTLASHLRVVRQVFLAHEPVPENIWSILKNAHDLTVGEKTKVEYVLPAAPLAAIPDDARRVPEPELPIVGFTYPFRRM